MASLLTNTSAMTALQTLISIDADLGQTQKRVSTGLKIGEAADNVAYWSISTMMRSDSSTLSAVTESLEMGVNQIGIAEETTTKSKEYLDSMNTALVTAYEKGEGDVKKIQDAVGSSAEGISSAVSSATLAEKNILGNGGQSVRVAGSYRREGSTVYVDMINVGSDTLNFATQNADGSYDLSKGQLSSVFGTTVKIQRDATTGVPVPDTNSPPAYADGFLREVATGSADLARGIKESVTIYVTAKNAYEASTKDAAALATFTAARDALDASYSVMGFTEADFTLAETTDATTTPPTVTPSTQLDSEQLEALVQSLQRKVTATTQNVVSAGAELGASKLQIQNQINYVGKLIDAIDTGIGALVDADMNAESARLSSLQVQQQLGIQALSIANQSSQTLLSLFQS